MTDADKQGLFRRLRRRAPSRTPLAPGPTTPGSRDAMPLRSDWLRAAFGLEPDEVLRRPSPQEPVWLGGVLRVDAIVEPVWIPEELEQES